MKRMPRNLKEMVRQNPILSHVMEAQPVFWENPDYAATRNFQVKGVSEETISDAENRFLRFNLLIKTLFPEAKGGLISPISEIPKMKSDLENFFQTRINGSMLLKRDDLLPVAGSIKARGGFHEVLAFAESLAFEHGLLKSMEDDYLTLLSPFAKDLFGQYTISVGSTGNLGLSIGMIGSALGFHVAVHMSSDAKEWKKSLLRKNGVKVVEHPSDYTKAVELARKESDENEKSYFVDDESSSLLFSGYAAAAVELKNQLHELGLEVNAKRPLFVYLPCGVGGGPGGVAFGLKSVFGENVHCFFAEPTHSPCMLVGLVTKQHNQISVQDLGLDNKTEADGLAVGRASVFVGKIMEELLSGCYTIDDDELFRLLYQLAKSEGIFLEPSALAGMKGPLVVRSEKSAKMEGDHPIHLVWATGGSLVPKEMREEFLDRGKQLYEG